MDVGFQLVILFSGCVVRNMLTPQQRWCIDSLLHCYTVCLRVHTVNTRADIRDIFVWLKFKLHALYSVLT